MSPPDGPQDRTRNNYPLAVAGFLAVLTAAVHVVVGTQEVHGPLLRSSFDTGVLLELYAVWHVVSLTLVASAGLLLWATWGRGKGDRALVVAVSVLWTLFGVVFIAVDLALAGPAGLLSAPQWSILLLVGVLGLYGARRLTGASS